jgi:hypothetical protein
MTFTTLPDQPAATSRLHHPHARYVLDDQLAPSAPRTPRASRALRVPGAARAHLRATGSAEREAHDAPKPHRAIARYTDTAGRSREVVALPGHAGTVLVVDRDAATLGDRRLLAHLAADEPAENARLICRHYLRDRRSPRCRAVTPEDLYRAPFAEVCEQHEPERRSARFPAAEELRDREGRLHRLEALEADMSIPELRWRRCPSPGERGEPQTESVRDAVACLESYEPVRALTAGALVRHRGDPNLSVAVLRVELVRIDASRIVLNGGLRRAVLGANRTRGLSLSEIALRCGRVKRDARGNASGETSWLARRVGIAPESGGGTPTPWIHSEVLALIARSGLGISPREVEL